MEKERILCLVSEVQKNIEISGKQARIEFLLNQFANKIKSVCKRKDFPVDLEYMAVEYAINNITYENKKKAIASMSDEGQTVTFDNSAEIKKEDIDLDMYINKNITEIAQYAYMGW